MSKNSKKKSPDRAWTKAGTFSSYEEADAKRHKIGENPDVQTKVRRRNADNNFTVHYRENLKEVTDKKPSPKKEKLSKKERRTSKKEKRAQKA